MVSTITEKSLACFTGLFYGISKNQTNYLTMSISTLLSTIWKAALGFMITTAGRTSEKSAFFSLFELILAQDYNRISINQKANIPVPLEEKKKSNLYSLFHLENHLLLNTLFFNYRKPLQQITFNCLFKKCIFLIANFQNLYLLTLLSYPKSRPSNS